MKHWIKCSPTNTAVPTLVASAVFMVFSASTLAAAQPGNGSPPVNASPRATAHTGEVVVILAKEEAGTVDPTLASMTALRRPPFDSFRSLSRLSRSEIQLGVGQEQDVLLPNGRRVRLKLEQVLPNGKLRIRASINRPDKKDYLPLLQVVATPGDPFFVVGQSHQGGTLIVGIKVTP